MKKAKKSKKIVLKKRKIEKSAKKPQKKIQKKPEIVSLKEIRVAEKIEEKIISEIQNPPIQNIADFSKNILDDSDNLRKPKIRVIGIGGGACSIVSEIAARMKKSDFFAANTDARALATIKEAKKFQFGESVTKGLGTGMNPQLGEAAANSDRERIKKLFEGQDFCILIACLGGGASSGAAPIFAKAAREMNCLTYGIFTLPFGFEGERKMEIAKDSLIKTRQHLNAYSVIPNERIFKIIDKNTPLNQALSAVNKSLADNLEGLMEMICSPGLINIDFADLTAVLAGAGKLAYLSSVEVEGISNSVEANQGEVGGRDLEAAQKVVSSPLHPYTISGSRGILYNIVGGKDLQLAEVSRISKIISGMANQEAKIIFGINLSPYAFHSAGKSGNKIKLVLFAVGCGAKNVFSSQDPKKIEPIFQKIKDLAPNFSGKPLEKKEGLLKKKSAPKINKKRVEKSRPIGAKKENPLPKNKEDNGKIGVNFSPKGAENNQNNKEKEESEGGERAEIKEGEQNIFNVKKISADEKEEGIQKENNETESSSIPIKNSAADAKRAAKTDNYFWAGQMVIPDGKIRRSGTQIKKVAEEEKKEIAVKENTWDAPAIFRKDKKS